MEAMEVTDLLLDIADESDAKKFYQFTEQLRGDALSITNNIAEGSGSNSIKNLLNSFRTYAVGIGFIRADNSLPEKLSQKSAVRADFIRPYIQLRNSHCGSVALYGRRSFNFRRGQAPTLPFCPCQQIRYELRVTS